MARSTLYRWDDETDYLIVGSGASGATAAFVLSGHGVSTLVLEEGKWYRREDFKEPLFSAISTLFRDFGMRVAKGRGVIPILEGRCVGGSTVMNGAIVHRLPEKVHAQWAEDKLWSESLSYQEIDRCAGMLDQYLGVKRNLGPALPSLPVSHLLTKLQWRHQAMQRNAPGCAGSGRCLQGCPSGGKYSMERSFIPRAVQAGARLFEEHKVEKILFQGAEAEGVVCRLPSGERKYIRARKAILIAGGALQTPQLLWRSGYRHPELGHHFQCHLGIGITGFLGTPSRDWEGPPQGIEILEFDEENIKLATQLIPPDLLLARTPIPASQMVSWLGRIEAFSSWTGSVQSDSQGRLKRAPFGASLNFSPSARDLSLVRKSLRLLSELLFKMGAKRVFPGVSGSHGTPVELNSPTDALKLDSLALDARNYWLSVGHLFGTCRMGTDPQRFVVAPNFALNNTKKVFVIDASIFPTNIGVNPQHSIMSLAMKAAEGLLA